MSVNNPCKPRINCECELITSHSISIIIHSSSRSSTCIWPGNLIKIKFLFMTKAQLRKSIWRYSEQWLKISDQRQSLFRSNLQECVCPNPPKNPPEEWQPPWADITLREEVPGTGTSFSLFFGGVSETHRGRPSLSNVVEIAKQKKETKETETVRWYAFQHTSQVTCNSSSPSPLPFQPGNTFFLSCFYFMPLFTYMCQPVSQPIIFLANPLESSLTHGLASGGKITFWLVFLTTEEKQV